MREASVVRFQGPEAVENPLTELLQAGAKQLIQKAVEAELADLLARYAQKQRVSGKAKVRRRGGAQQRNSIDSRRGNHKADQEAAAPSWEDAVWWAITMGVVFIAVAVLSTLMD